jgi:alkylated DNA repair dioxygenase AlkB
MKRTNPYTTEKKKPITRVTQKVDKQPFIDLGAGSWLRMFPYDEVTPPPLQQQQQQQQGEGEKKKLTKQSEVDLLWTFIPDREAHVMMFGKLVAVPRKQQVYGSMGYRFSGVMHDAVPVPAELQCYMTYANRVCAPHLPAGRQFNMMFVNWYVDGHSYIGFHSDDESQLYKSEQGETLVFSLSFGASREFVLQARDTVGASPTAAARNVKLTLAHHDVILMGGLCQTTHKHAVPKLSGKKAASVGRRVNITFRIFK